MNKKVNAMRQFKTLSIILAVLMAGAGCLYVFFQHKNSGQERIESTYEAYQLIEQADEVHFTGDGDAMTQKPTLWVGKKIVGKLVDKGFIHRQLQLFASEEMMMYLQFDETTLSDDVAGPTYAYFDANDNLLGYAEETRVFLDSSSEQAYVFFFYDQNKMKKNYYAYDNDDWKIYSEDGKVLLEGYYGYNFRNSEYAVTVITYDNQVNLQDKLLVFYMLLQNVSSNFPER